MALKKAEPPSDDRRWKMINATMRRHGYHRSALIEVLHTVQDVFGYLENEALAYVAESLRLPPSVVYGVATFYHFFTLKPKGEHACVVCTGTACYIKGAGDIIEAVKENYGIEPGETSEDGRFSLLTARCVGACSLAPAVVYDGEVAGYQSPEDVINTIGEWTENDA